MKNGPASIIIRALARRNNDEDCTRHSSGTRAVANHDGRSCKSSILRLKAADFGHLPKFRLFYYFTSFAGNIFVGDASIVLINRTSFY